MSFEAGIYDNYFYNFLMLCYDLALYPYALFFNFSISYFVTGFLQ